MRVVYFLGSEKSKSYFLNSEKIPADMAQPLANRLSSIKTLGKRIEILKDEYPFVYKYAFRVAPSSQIRVIEKYDK